MSYIEYFLLTLILINSLLTVIACLTLFKRFNLMYNTIKSLVDFVHHQNEVNKTNEKFNLDILKTLKVLTK